MARGKRITKEQKEVWGNQMVGDEEESWRESGEGASLLYTGPEKPRFSNAAESIQQIFIKQLPCVKTGLHTGWGRYGGKQVRSLPSWTLKFTAGHMNPKTTEPIHV